MMTVMKKHLADLNYPAPRAVSKIDDQVGYIHSAHYLAY